MLRHAPLLALLACAACADKSRCEPGITRAVTPTASPAALGGVSNGTVLQELGKHPLTAEALGANKAYLAALDTSENERVVLQHLVECALDASVKFTLKLPSQDLELQGIAGYGAEWASGPCTESCQEWVTACSLARVNYYGIPVRIFLRSQKGIDAQPPTPEELARFSVEEGAFFGNMFLFPQRVYACRGRGFDPLYMTFRVCTDGEYPCGIITTGPCGPERDGATGLASDRWSCEGYDQVHGTYVNCHGRTTTDGTFPPGKTYPGVVTVTVRHTSFSASAEETRCE